MSALGLPRARELKQAIRSASVFVIPYSDQMNRSRMFRAIGCRTGQETGGDEGFLEYLRSLQTPPVAH